ncbi:hypothetical protein DAPPUDRAFT_251527 [Daphnia pulex]|uniref:Uncharacterized protein n=1 Tax=Daphnia pulex TaxID=6669 RepID=E9H0L8_DAPPU|nr:hypothetical protein DAPPUDRAFT_251527 [Daphnia pulex]|eukprot:EFX74670.1 hypothetical protein DAPPUDRAFT_251527 [Daphnia pulex]
MFRLSPAMVRDSRLAAQDLGETGDIEDLGGSNNNKNNRPTVTSKRKRGTSEATNELDKNWREILVPSPPMVNLEKSVKIEFDGEQPVEIS